MKTLFLSFLLISSLALYSQETIKLGEDVMNTFDTPGTECYDLTIEEAGDYLLYYNLMDVTIKVIYDGQEPFSDYMATFAVSPKEEQITFQNTGTYQICFSTTGTMAVYQCRIVKAGDSGPGESIPLQYGEYVIKEITADNSPINYFFRGSENEKIRIGISGMFVANLKITSPANTILYDQSFAEPPADGLKLDFELEETGDYLITITPMMSYLQYSLSLYLLEPVQASFIAFNELSGGVLVNFGVDYYHFYAYAGDTLQINYTGSTAYITMQVKTPGGEIINCDEIIDESHLVHTLGIEEDGTYVIIISYNMQGFLGYGLTIDLEFESEPYELGTLIIKELALKYKKVYSFHASQDNILRIGLDLPSKFVELIDPGGNILFSLDSTAGAYNQTVTFKEITLDSTGEYLISLWHDHTAYSPVEFKFCASLVPEPEIIDKDSVYSITVFPYRRLPIAFNADAGEVVRLGFPTSSAMVTPAGDTVILNTDDAFLLPQAGTYIINVFNYSTDPVQLEIWVKTAVPPQEISFGIITDYEVSGIYTCTVPPGLDNLFVIVKKSSHIGYDGTWRGSVSLQHGDQTWQSMAGTGIIRDDFIFMLEQPDSGLYILTVFAESLDEEARGSVLFTGQLPEAQLNKWSSGVITRPYGSDWKMIEIGQSTDTLYFETEGFGMWSTLYVAYNHISNPEANWEFRNWGEGYHITGKIPNAPAGHYYIRYMDSAVLMEDNNYNYKEDQARTYMLYVGSALADNTELLALRDVSTHTLGAGNASIVLTGSGLSSVTEVSLVSEDEQVTISMNITSVSNDGRELVAGYDFSGVEPGIYHLEVQNSDTLVRYSNNIEILPLVTATISSSMLTSDIYRVGREQKCIIRVSNNGTTDIPYIAGYFYTTSELMRILITDTPDSEYDAGLLNEALQDEIFTEMPFFIENLRVGDEAVFIYNIFSSSIPADESFKVGYMVGVLSEADYYALQEPMATAWYQFLISSEITPDTMKSYLEEIKLEGFIDIWNHNTNTNLKKSGGSQSSKSRIENGTNKFVTVLDNAPGKLPFAIPYQIAKQGVKVISDKGKECANSLERLNEYVKSMNENPFDEEEKNKNSVNSSTPEDKYGPVGHGMDYGNGYIGDRDLFEYRIDYWNKENATAPAAIVYIRDTIDTNFDLKTLRFTEIGFLRWKLKLDGGQYFNINVDCRPDMPYIVNVEGKVDYASREVYWVHTTLDPETMELPDDPMAGYLPPIDSTGYQMGWVNFTIRPEGQLPHGTRFENQAFVNFDGVGPWGPAPPYGPYTNTFDFVSPWSYVDELDPVQTTLTFDINVYGEDEGSGISHFDIYVSKDYEEAYLWKTTEDSIMAFTGVDGTRYEFYSVAADKVGNTEEMKTVYDTYTFIDLAYTGTEEYPHDNISTLKVIPNPNDGVFRIGIDESHQKGILYILDLAGRIICQTECIPGEVISLDHLSSGLYLLNFRSSDGCLFSKLIIL